MLETAAPRFDPPPAPPGAVNRRAYIGSSDARDILEGRWTRPWAEKTGRAAPEDLSRVFRVQLGVHTEPFHLAWIAGHVAESGEIGDFASHANCFVPSMALPYVASHPDAIWVTADHEWIPVEVKHSSGRKSVEDVVSYYMPQLQHHLYCLGAERLLFSVIPANEEPVRTWIGASGPWFDAIEAAYPAFWKHVADDVSPAEQPYDLEDRPLIQPGIASVPINGMTARDATMDNHFSVLAREFIETKEAHGLHEKAKGELKGLVAATEREVFNAALSIRRDARGALRFSIKG